MNNDQHIHLITAYLERNLSADERQQLDQLVESGQIDLLELKELEGIYRRTGAIDIPEPAEDMNERFYQMLDEHKQEQNHGILTSLGEGWGRLKEAFTLRRVAYACCLFLAGLLLGDIYAPISKQDEQVKQLSSQVHQLREMMMISLLDDSSPIERLKAVNIGNEISTADQRVVQALLHTLNNDSNINVRLAAVEALVRHGSNPDVRRGLVDAINRQESPIVQSALADAMLQLQERRSVDELKKLLDRNELDGTVRNKLETTIAALNS